VDAAVATAFALVAAYPPAGNLGGGGFMLVHPGPGKGEPVVFDYRESAPAAARSNMFTPEESQFTHKSVAVPGTIRGLALAHQRFGTLPWRELLQPAIALARNGFLLDTNLADSMNVTLAAAPEKSEFQRVFGKPGGGLWRLGDRLVQPDLARTLEMLADLGPDAFYQGPIADEFLAEIAGGVARMQGNEIASGSGSAFAQALRSLAGAFANVLATLADVLAGTGLSLMVLALLHGLRLRGPLILRRIGGARECGQTQQQ